MTWNIINGNSAEILKTYPDNSFDAVVTDPPYGINFLGKSWDSNTGDREIYEQCFRVLKPGGHLLAFSAARTYHHLAMTVELCGFEIKDQIMWIYGSGFPKSQDVGRQIDKAAKRLVTKGTGKTKVSGGAKEFPNGPLPRTEQTIHIPQTEEAKQWAGWGTSLKPAHEPIVMARKPVIGSVRENVQKYGTGAINIGECRVGNEVVTTMYKVNTEGKSFGYDGEVEWEDRGNFDNVGRFPANVIHDGSDEVVSLFPDTKSTKRSDKNNKSKPESSDHPFTPKETQYGDHNTYEDQGSAARFFYCPKVSRSERHIGHTAPKTYDRREEGLQSAGIQGLQKLNGEKKTEGGNNHPTVKPIELMKYLIKLVTPPNGHVLDPFNGSGSTGCAAIELGYDYTGIELDPKYVEIATKRLTAWETSSNTIYNSLFIEV